MSSLAKSIKAKQLQDLGLAQQSESASDANFMSKLLGTNANTSVATNSYVPASTDYTKTYNAADSLFNKVTNTSIPALSSFNLSEQQGLGTSYNNLGGLSGTGMSYNDWLTSQGIDPTTAQDTTLGLTKDQWGNIGTIADLGKGLAGLYFANKQYGLQKDAFNFNKDMALKEYAMAKDAYDRNALRAEGLGAAMKAGKTSSAVV